MITKKKVRNDCEMATFLIEKGQITKLTACEYCYMKFHLAFCSMCRIFQKQSRNISRMTKTLLSLPDKSTIKLDEKFKGQLQSLIEKKL